MGNNVNPILEWTKRHPQVDVRIRWSDSLSRYRVEVSMTDRHICMVLDQDMVEGYLENVLDDMLSAVLEPIKGGMMP